MARGDRGRWGQFNGFVDLDLRGRTRAEVAVWLVLFRDARGGVARTGQADIARRAGLTVRGVQKALARLAAAGLVTVARRGRLGAGVSTYRVGDSTGRHDEAGFGLPRELSVRKPANRGSPVPEGTRTAAPLDGGRGKKTPSGIG